MEIYLNGPGDHSPSSWRDVKKIREELIAKGVKLPILKTVAGKTYAVRFNQLAEEVRGTCQGETTEAAG
jgi:hypothetical protein